MLALDAVEDHFIQLLEPILDPVPIEPFPEVTGFDDYIENIDSAMGAVIIAVSRATSVESHEGADEFAFSVEFYLFKSSFRSRHGHRGSHADVKKIVDSVHSKKATIAGVPVKTYVDDAYFFGKEHNLYGWVVESAVLPKFARRT